MSHSLCQSLLISVPKAAVAAYWADTHERVKVIYLMATNDEGPQE